MGEAADPAVDPGIALEVQAGEGMGLGRAGLDLEMAQEGLAHQMGRPPGHGAHPQIDVGFAVMDGGELGVAIGQVQQRDRAEGRRIIEVGRRLFRMGEAARQRQSSGAGGAEDLKEFAPVHLLTGDWGSSNSDIRWRICCSVRMPIWPPRGMFEQALKALPL